MKVRRRYCSLREEKPNGLCRWRLSIAEEKGPYASVCLGVNNLSHNECEDIYLHIIEEERR